MSYAGPASRERTTPNIEAPASTEISGRGGFRTTTPFRPRTLPGARRDTYLAFAAGIALGLTIGAGTALLLAPHDPQTSEATLKERTEVDRCRPVRILLAEGRWRLCHGEREHAASEHGRVEPGFGFCQAQVPEGFVE